MNIQTTSGNIYSYLRKTNEIVGGVVDDHSFVWNYDKIMPFSEMPNVNMFIIGITEQCNLRCTYCCYSGDYKNNRSHGMHSLDFKDIDRIFDFIKKTAKKLPIRIAFYGGEPLIRFSQIQYAVERGIEIWGEQVTYSVSTNGILLNSSRIDWLASKQIELAISLDGTEKFHNKNRVDILGMSSYSKIYDAISYIKNVCPEYMKFISLQMTLSSYRIISDLAEEWAKDPLLKDISPSNIHGLTPNFSIGVDMINYSDVLKLYMRLLDLYEKNQNWTVLKTFFEESISYWHNRPIVAADDTVPMPTCMPINTKLFFDSNLRIGVCEKMADKYRIGTIQDGIDWDKANSFVKEYYNKRVHRCKHCPAVRMCDICLTAVEYSEEQWETLCHNEQVYAKVFMTIFCEMAERGLIK